MTNLEDSKIIDLFFARSEQAIDMLAKKYGGVCTKIAENILNNRLDVEECLNDAYLGVWNTIPPQRPNPLISYVSKIVRNRAIAKYHANTALKRNSYYDVALDELSECLADISSVEDEVTANELTKILNDFLATLDKDKRVMFVRRYWYADSVTDIAKRFHVSNNYVSVNLLRIRESLKEYLKKEGYI